MNIKKELQKKLANDLATLKAVRDFNGANLINEKGSRTIEGLDYLNQLLEEGKSVEDVIVDNCNCNNELNQETLTYLQDFFNSVHYQALVVATYKNGKKEMNTLFSMYDAIVLASGLYDNDDTVKSIVIKNVDGKKVATFRE